MIQESQGYYYAMAALFAVVGVGMLFGAYWGYEAREITHVAVSLLFSFLGLWYARGFVLKANALKKEADPDRQRTTRGM